MQVCKHISGSAKTIKFIRPSEPLFNQIGWRPMVIYLCVAVLIGRPCWFRGHKYRGKQLKSAVAEISDYCREEIERLLQQGMS
jgi:hypothetical protein